MTLNKKIKEYINYNLNLLENAIPDIFSKKEYFYQPFHLTEHVAGKFNGKKLNKNPKEIASLYQTEIITLYDHTYGCPSICNYCGFFTKSPPNKRKILEDHIDLKQEERRLLLSKLPSIPVSAIYFGGGTPTILSGKLLKKLIEGYQKDFNIIPEAELTVESHPNTINKNKLEMLAELGINRLSIGIQTLNKKLLAECNRNYSQEKALEVINLSSNIFKYVNVDLMYGLKGQKIEDHQETLKKIVDSGVNQITTYPLWLRPKSKVEKDFKKIETKEYPSGKEMASMYFLTKFFLEQNKFSQDLVGWYSKNKNKVGVYPQRWKEQIPCLGFGAGSYSYGKDFQYEHHWNWDNYKKELRQGKIPIQKGFKLSEKEQILSKLLWLLKAGQPINANKKEIKILQPFISNGLLYKEKEMVNIPTPAKSIIEYIISKII